MANYILDKTDCEIVSFDRVGDTMKCELVSTLLGSTRLEVTLLPDNKVSIRRISLINVN